MVDMYGKWTAEKDYKDYPEYKWCDCDYIANWVMNLGYNPKTNIENLVEMILSHYNCYLSNKDIEFYIDKKKESENGLMISIEDVCCFVEDNGGLKEFDYYC